MDGGEVAQADASTEWDGENSVLVAATSEGNALHIATMYDKGLVQSDNMTWDGQTIAVVAVRNSDSGKYL